MKSENQNRRARIKLEERESKAKSENQKRRARIKLEERESKSKSENQTRRARIKSEERKSNLKSENQNRRARIKLKERESKAKSKNQTRRARAQSALMGHRTSDDIAIADGLLLKFCQRSAELYGDNAITRNMHMHCHLASCLREFGLVYSFWLFPFERYNGILEDQPTNNRSIEMQLMRRFLRDNLHLHLQHEAQQWPDADLFLDARHMTYIKLMQGKKL